jgi:hypothetical protein
MRWRVRLTDWIPLLIGFDRLQPSRTFPSIRLTTNLAILFQLDLDPIPVVHHAMDVSQADPLSDWHKEFCNGVEASQVLCLLVHPTNPSDVHIVRTSNDQFCLS